MLIFQRKVISWLENDNMTSVLECSADLRSVQSELQINFTINGFCFRVIRDAAKANIAVFFLNKGKYE